MDRNRVCPWWLGYFLINPLRKYSNNPDTMFRNFVKPGMTVIDFGCAMGYFSLPLARMVGDSGKVYCFDIQQKMLDKLKKRAAEARLDQVVFPVLIDGNGRNFDGLDQVADFALLFAVAHEVPDQRQLFVDLYRMLKPGALLYFAEPAGHVRLNEFEHSVSLATAAGFSLLPEKLLKTHSVLLQR